MEYKISIVVEGQDRASAPLGRVGSALSNMSQIAGGIIGAQVLTSVASGILSFGKSAVQATADLQQMEASVLALIAREMALASASVAAGKDAENGLGLIANGALTIAEAMPLAEQAAKDMTEELAKIAIASPYQLSAVQNSFKMAMAFGYTSEEAKKFTKALLDVGAATGADNARLERIAYNLAQVRMAGKIGAVDIRQLAMAGFDLNAVLRQMGDDLQVPIENYTDFNAALDSGLVSWEQFTDSFAKYADTNFGGASERMSQTLNGLKSTFADLFILTMPKIFQPALEKFTAFAVGLLGGLISIRDSGILEAWGESISAVMDKVLGFLDPLADNFINLFETIADAGVGGLEFREALGLFLGPTLMDAFTGVSNAIRLVSDAFRKVRDVLAPYVALVISFIADNVKFQDILMVIGVIIASAVIPAFIGLLATVLPIILTIGSLIAVFAILRTAWENNWGGIRDYLITTWNGTIKPALQQLWTWLQVNVPLAIAALVAYWNTVLLPALQSLWAWIQEFVIPALLEMVAWLQVNVPKAIDALMTFWNTKLLPALQAFWTFVQTYVLPALVTAALWLGTNVPIAIEALRSFFVDKLIPALTGVWSYITTYVIPIFSDIIAIFLEVSRIIITIVVAAWKQKLQPALEGVYNFIMGNLQKAFKWLVDFLGIDTAKAMDGLRTGPLKLLRDAFEKFKEILDKVKDFLGKIREALANLNIEKLLDILGLGGKGGAGGGHDQAYGGAVQFGRSYLVGERGPEPFVPSTNGRVFSNSDMKGYIANIIENMGGVGGGGNNYTMNIYGAGNKENFIADFNILKLLAS